MKTPEGDKIMIVDAERIRLLKTNGLFKGISESILKPYTKPKYFFEVKEGEIIYVCGDKSSELFLIVEGEVKIKSSGSGRVKHKYLSDFFGEEEILKGGERNSSAIANTDCVLFRISSTEFKQLSLSNKKIVDNLSSTDEDESSSVPNNEPPENQSQMYSSEKTVKYPVENLDSESDVEWKIEDTE